METHGDSPESDLRHARPSSARTARIVSGALERSERRQGWLAPGVALAAVAALLLVAFAWKSLPAPGVPTLASGVSARTTDAPATYRAGDHEVRIALGSEVRAARVDRNTTALEVVRGSAGFKVRHLVSGERFWVTAGPVTVEAVGTQFAVAMEGLCVRVVVDEGRVQVRRDERPAEYLGMGDSHVYCQRPGGPEALTEEERLVFGALDDVRRGGAADLVHALERFNEYQRRFPHGAYEEEALYYLARIAKKLGRDPQARQWAQDLVERFPTSRRAAELDELRKQE